MSATEELTGILNRRQEINEKLEEGQEIKPKYKFVNVYTEFHEFSRKEIKQYEETFNNLAKNESPSKPPVIVELSPRALPSLHDRLTKSDIAHTALSSGFA
ncbi:EF-hand domain-containing protein D2 homolog [Eumeta japonica]|uniref:EF-hand domain-containing protein D2 homolog n=1 Tax=Eumeta variegata TaxID=151549 RepID=A0A4C2ACE8_EUMVA|nr:EF-hand domain-containing protein D2 homolog [Eumeta japonica]